MTMTELADLILTRMYDLAQTQGYAEQFDVRAIAREFGEHEYMKVFNASKVLEDKGWILANFTMDEGIHAFLTGEGSIAVERGGITGIIHAFRQNPRRFLVVDQSTHYHGPISGQNIALNSQVGSVSSNYRPQPIGPPFIRCIRLSSTSTKSSRTTGMRFSPRRSITTAHQSPRT
jgi:hypothetical protein